MRVAFIVTIRKRTGPVVVVGNLIEALLQLHPDIKIKVFYFDESDENIFPASIPTERICLSTKMDFSQYDIVHTHMLRSDLYMFRHFLEWRKTSCRWVSTIHQQTFSNQRRRLGLGMSLMLTPIWYFAWLFCPRICCVGKTIRKEHPYRRSLVVYNGVPDVAPGSEDGDLAHLLQTLRDNGRRIAVGCSNIIQVKGIEQTVSALTSLPEYDYVHFGEGKEKANLVALAERLGVADRCHFVGQVHDPAQYYHLCDIFLMTSRSEGCCQAGLEANAAGMPIVCSSIPQFTEIYDGFAEFFELGDVNGLVGAVQRAYDNRELLAKRSRELYESQFSSLTMARNYYAVYSDLTRKDRQ